MRRQRENHPARGIQPRADAANNRRSAYEPDSRARTSQPAYAGYEVYEEYAEDAPEPQPLPRTRQPQQPRQHANVVSPIVTLPSVPAASVRRGHAPSPTPTPAWRRTGGPDLSPESPPETMDVGDDDSWLTSPSPSVRRTAAHQPPRPTRAGPATPGRDPHDAGQPYATAGRQAVGHPHVPPRRQPATPDVPAMPGTAYVPYTGQVVAATALAPRPHTPRHRLTHAEVIAPDVVRVGRIRLLTQRVADVVLIPVARHVVPSPVRGVLAGTGRAISGIARRPVLASCLVLAVLLIGFLLDVTGAAQQAGIFSAGAWQAVAGTLPSSGALINGPITAPPNYDAKHYMTKYGFYQPGKPTPISSDEWARLVQMVPAAIRAAQAYDKRYNKSIEPQMLLYWTHAEGIRARINYSNCANEPANYNSYIANCDHANFWQLGYGNQFGVIYVLRNAFTDLYGDPNDAQLVSKVGQWVLDFDKQMGTTPPCGGYSCTFPSKTIDQILAGVNLRTGVVAEGNWWASVLSRDPAINSYMITHALTYFSHEATRNWVGCYYAAPCWQRNSDRLGDILAAWPDLIKAAGIQG